MRGTRFSLLFARFSLLSLPFPAPPPPRPALGRPGPRGTPASPGGFRKRLLRFDSERGNGGGFRRLLFSFFFVLFCLVMAGSRASLLLLASHVFFLYIPSLFTLFFPLQLYDKLFSRCFFFFSIGVLNSVK